MNNWIQLVGVSVTVAAFIGGMVVSYFHLVLKSNLGEVKDVILTAVKEEYQLAKVYVAEQTDIKRRIRDLERKVFKTKNDST